MNFHESGYARALFERDVPAISKHLKMIGEELKRANDLKEEEMKEKKQNGINRMCKLIKLYLEKEFRVHLHLTSFSDDIYFFEISNEVEVKVIHEKNNMVFYMEERKKGTENWERVNAFREIQLKNFEKTLEIY